MLQYRQPKQVEGEIWRADALEVRRGLSSELDEMWSYVQSKAHPRWLWHAIDHHTGKVLIIEAVVPGPDTPHFSKLFDIHMMIGATGWERTVEEYTGLLEGAGWTYRQTWYPASKMLGVVEPTFKESG